MNAILEITANAGTIGGFRADEGFAVRAGTATARWTRAGAASGVVTPRSPFANPLMEDDDDGDDDFMWDDEDEDDFDSDEGASEDEEFDYEDDDDDDAFGDDEDDDDDDDEI